MTLLDEARMIVARALEQPFEDITPDDALDTAPGWDSLGHMRIVLGLEAKLVRMLDTHEIVEIKSVSDIVALLQRQNAAGIDLS